MMRGMEVCIEGTKRHGMGGFLKHKNFWTLVEVKIPDTRYHQAGPGPGNTVEASKRACFSVLHMKEDF